MFSLTLTQGLGLFIFISFSRSYLATTFSKVEEDYPNSGERVEQPWGVNHDEHKPCKLRGMKMAAHLSTTASVALERLMVMDLNKEREQ